VKINTSITPTMFTMAATSLMVIPALHGPMLHQLADALPEAGFVVIRLGSRAASPNFSRWVPGSSALGAP
jgi:hypothetical protein